MKKLLSLVFGLCMTISCFAQDTLYVDSIFIGKVKDTLSVAVYVGPNYSCNENLDRDFNHKFFYINGNSISYGGQAIVAREFSKLLGWRASAGFFSNKGRANFYSDEAYDGYTFYDAEVFGDLTFDFRDLFLSKNRKHKNNYQIKAFLGIGGAFSFGFPENSDFTHEGHDRCIMELYQDGEPSNGFHIGARAGINASWKVSKTISLGLQASITLFDDYFNGYSTKLKTDTRQDLMLGLTYTIPTKHQRIIPAPVPEPVIIPESEPEPVVIPEPEPEPVVIPEPEPEPEPIITSKILEELTIPLHFQIRESDILSQHKDRIQKLVDFVNAHKTTKITVKGYADIQTGNPKLNIGYSKSRAQKTTAELIRIFNISPDKIETTWYGDTVQPFAENDLNRCAILSVKEVE